MLVHSSGHRFKGPELDMWVVKYAEMLPLNRPARELLCHVVVENVCSVMRAQKTQRRQENSEQLWSNRQYTCSTTDFSKWRKSFQISLFYIQSLPVKTYNKAFSILCLLRSVSFSPSFSTCSFHSQICIPFKSSFHNWPCLLFAVFLPIYTFMYWYNPLQSNPPFFPQLPSIVCLVFVTHILFPCSLPLGCVCPGDGLLASKGVRVIQTSDSQ